MSNRAWVTLATNDSYGLGALVLAHSLRRAGSSYPSVVLITPTVTDPMRDRLRAVFAEVVIVDVLDSRDATHLALLQRPELGITFTKIHCWGLTQYEKCVFLDADTLIVQNCDELFEREELSAAPDVGWPDCFNSGVFVYKPSAETFEKLIKFAQERGSFDGGDQGLLNSFFSDWAHGDINKHLPFLYNVTSAAFYSYLPALKHYGQNLKIIHFIGAAKPWLQQFNFQSRSVDAPDHLREFLQLWWDLFVTDVHSQLDETMSGVAGNLARVVAGVGAPREALDELTRRQGWEAGNIDYMGADSFDNIWAKISQTLNQTRISPPKQPSPPKEAAPPKEPSPPKEQSAPAPAPVAAPMSDEPPVATEAPVVAETPAAVEAAVPIEAPVTAEAPNEVPITAEVPVTAEAPAPVEAPKVEPAQSEIPATIEQPTVKAPPAAEIPATVETPAGTAVSVEPPAVEETKKTEEPIVPPTPPATPKSTPKASTPESAPVVAQESVPVTVEPPKSAPAAKVAKPAATPEKSEAPVATDSPPLANTPSKEEAPSLPAAKSEERRKPAGKLQLRPPAGADPLPTPDSELEDAAELAQSIIASELQPATPVPAQPTPPAQQPERLSVADPEVPTPPVGAVSLEQIGVKPKGKSSTAAQIESSVTEKEPEAPQTPTTPTTPTDKPADAPKKKVVKKVKSKEGASGDAPVPPPRKKEKKPKEK